MILDGLEIPDLTALQSKASKQGFTDWVYGYWDTKKKTWLRFGHTIDLDRRGKEYLHPKVASKPSLVRLSKDIKSGYVERYVLDAFEYDLGLADSESSESQKWYLSTTGLRTELRSAAVMTEIELCHKYKTMSHYGKGGLNYIEGDFMPDDKFDAKTRPERCQKLLEKIATFNSISGIGSPTPDAEERAIYWQEPGEGERTSLQMFLVDSPICRASWDGVPYLPPQGRTLGFVENKIFKTERDRSWHYLRKLQAYTFNHHVLLNHQKYGFEKVEVHAGDKIIVSVPCLLKCSKVPRKLAGNYEAQIYYPYQDPLEKVQQTEAA